MSHVHYAAAAVRRHLDYPGCIAAIAEAMRAFSTTPLAQPLRQIVPLAPGQVFAVMPGTRGAACDFGAKVISVFADPSQPGRSQHQGLVLLFDPLSGALTATADAGEITHIRTAAASAVATAALSRPDATRLSLYGCGAQAWSHAHALVHVRPIAAITVWGRREAPARALAEQLERELALPVRFEPDGERAAQADIICTVSSANEPILKGAWLAPGSHVNIVGSSLAGPVEVDHAVLLRGRYIVDSRASVLAAGAEFLNARDAGLIADDYIAGEIGEVLANRVAGRRHAEEVTLYKSLGHIAQDLAALAYLHRRAKGNAPPIPSIIG